MTHSLSIPGTGAYYRNNLKNFARRCTYEQYTILSMAPSDG